MFPSLDGRGVLMMCLELCGLNFRPGAQSRVDFVSRALFGYGAAGCHLMAAFGPGFTVSFALLDICAG